MCALIEIRARGRPNPGGAPPNARSCRPSRARAAEAARNSVARAPRLGCCPPHRESGPRPLNRQTYPERNRRDPRLRRPPLRMGQPGAGLKGRRDDGDDGRRERADSAGARLKLWATQRPCPLTRQNGWRSFPRRVQSKPAVRWSGGRAAGVQGQRLKAVDRGGRARCRDNPCECPGLRQTTAALLNWCLRTERDEVIGA
jgi:hypothetical protein